MSDFNDLMTKVHLLDENYSRLALKEKQDKIFKLYEGLYEELNELIKETIVNIKIDSGEYDVTIMITSSKGLLISELYVILNKLLFLADMKNIKIVEGRIILKLWFRCWEYRKKEK